jgi:hypothetical protein
LGDIVIANCPMTTAARSVAVTVPRLKPASYIGPIQNPMASAKKIASSGYARSVLTNQSTIISRAFAFQHLLVDVGAVAELVGI